MTKAVEKKEFVEKAVESENAIVVVDVIIVNIVVVVTGTIFLILSKNTQSKKT